MSDFSTPPTINQPSFKLDFQSASIKGLYLAGISIVLFVVLYSLGVSYLVNPISSGVILVASIGATIYFGIDERNKVYGGYLEYFQAYKVLMVISVVSMVVYQLFNILMFAVIDPELPAKMTDAIIELTRSMIPDSVDDATLDETLESVRADTLEKFGVSPIRVAINLGQYLAMSAVFNLLLALFVRRKREMFN